MSFPPPGAVRSGDGIEAPLSQVAAGPCSIVFCPRNLVVVPECIAPRGNADAVKLSGVVRHREFLGSLIRYAVASAGSAFLVDDSRQRGQLTLNPGDRAELFTRNKEIVTLAR